MEDLCFDGRWQHTPAHQEAIAQSEKTKHRSSHTHLVLTRHAYTFRILAAQIAQGSPPRPPNNTTTQVNMKERHEKDQ